MEATVTKLEPKRSKARHNDGGLTRRVVALERRMTAVEETAQTAATKATEAADNTAQLLSIVTATKGAAAIIRKHGPRAIAFVTGILATAGIGNPKVLAFIGNFFGN